MLLNQSSTDTGIPSVVFLKADHSISFSAGRSYFLKWRHIVEDSWVFVELPLKLNLLTVLVAVYALIGLPAIVCMKW